MNEFREKNMDEVFCRSCGSIIKKEAEICPKCGVRQLSSGFGISINGSGDRWTTTLLLCLLAFFGIAGVHRFYTGKIATGILMLITFGMCGVWTLIDLIMIVLNQFRDSNGNLITRN